MATATQKDDDILVVSESAPSDDFDFHFDFGDTESPAEAAPVEEKSSTSDTLDFTFLDSDAPESEAVSAISESPLDQKTEKSVNMKSAVSDFFSADTASKEKGNADISEKSSPTETNTDEEKTVEIPVESALISEEVLAPQTQARVEPLETPEVKAETRSENSGSMNEILDATIAKLLARKESIGDEKSAKAAEVEKIKAEISELQAEKKELEKEIASLDAENAKIDENKTSLEKMKI